MNTNIITQGDENRSSGEIEAGIHQARSRMDATLDELGNRLTPKSLLNSALDWWHSQDSGQNGNGAASKAVYGLARQARRHPLPALLIGSGVVWLVAESTDDDDEGPERSAHKHTGNIDPSVSEGTTGLAHKVGQAADGAKEKANELGERLHEATDNLSHKAHDALDKGKTSLRKIKDEATEGYETGMRGFDRACNNYPLAVGVGFGALGILAGLVLPRTSREDKWMGEQSDQLREDTREKTKELLETGKAVGNSVVETVKEEIAKQGITEETVAAKFSELADKGGDLFLKAKDEAIETADERGLPLPSSMTKEKGPKYTAS